MGQKTAKPLHVLSNYNIGVFRKNEHFLGYVDFVDIFWGHHEIGLYLGFISIRLSEAVPMRPFFRVKNGGRWRMNHTRGRNLRGKCIVCLFNLTD